MTIPVIFSILMVICTTLVHYEVLRGLSTFLPSWGGSCRRNLIIVIFVTFLSHVVQICLYGVGLYILVNRLHLGTLGGSPDPSFALCVLFSAEAFTSLGLGDVVNAGATRFLAGIEALNGLLLIGWSASYIYISMERFWEKEGRFRNREPGRREKSRASGQESK